MGAFVRAAYIAKPKSLNGWVVCHAADDLSFALTPGVTVHFVPPSLRGPRSATVAEIKEVRPDTWEVRFEGIDSVDTAQDICDCYCLVDEQDAVIEQAPSSTQHMVGLTLIETTVGEIGPIVDVQHGVAQDLLVVETAEGEVLVPAVDAFLGPIDTQAGTIHATLPAGLLELGRSNSNTANSQ